MNACDMLALLALLVIYGAEYGWRWLLDHCGLRRARIERPFPQS